MQKASPAVRTPLRVGLLCIIPLLAFVGGYRWFALLSLPFSLAGCVLEVFRKRVKKAQRLPPFATFLVGVYCLQVLIFLVYSMLQPRSYRPVRSSGALVTMPPPHHISPVVFVDQEGEWTAEENQAAGGQARVGLRKQTVDSEFFLGDAPFSPPQQCVSIILAAHNEQQYAEKTLSSIYENTPTSVLKEVIIVDDGSDPPMETAFDRARFPDVIILRSDERQGLIRSKNKGGDAATGDIIIFLDAHVKPLPHWVDPLIRHINTNYKRVVVPLIPVLDGQTWEVNNNAVGIKMMFDWSLAFNWFDDGNDLVPCMSGGLLAMSKRWWTESGRLDDGMLEWGGENIEQSVRVWRCGGEIFVARDSRVGHVFRPKFPYKLDNNKVLQNKVRAVEVWFDDAKEKFYNAVPSAKNLVKNIGDTTEREDLKRNLQCKPFSWYMTKFHDVFVDRGLIPVRSFFIRHRATGKCVIPLHAGPPYVFKNVIPNTAKLTSFEQTMLVLADCNSPQDKNSGRRWAWRNGGKSLEWVNTSGKFQRKCMDAANPPKSAPSIRHVPVIFMCEEQNHNQVWEASGGRITHASLCLDAAHSPPYVTLNTCHLARPEERGDMHLPPDIEPPSASDAMAGPPSDAAAAASSWRQAGAEGQAQADPAGPSGVLLAGGAQQEHVPADIADPGALPGAQEASGESVGAVGQGETPAESLPEEDAEGEAEDGAPRRRLGIADRRGRGRDGMAQRIAREQGGVQSQAGVMDGGGGGGDSTPPEDLRQNLVYASASSEDPSYLVSPGQLFDLTDELEVLIRVEV
uniref:Glycosyltransferase 2-like domain-containing protein n=1 Tax=Chromera velia CCMP2878 TaxID=1169474 RepID=A0A0G4I9Y1_9ALVE|eukprot:Cvel_12293.t1-p1 / transcript=Cvel_12293.t1 / gene=Cvel_12293 / organism=Chromera_velia_CCMP2878 / gene_product=Polypeptide N-acetylgalactosaminyltransferase 14, putative / transcript_product=Polypeptide N-acetylgalactosaminyltransferase 14, putative / location=Cvel_scaffold798:22795-30405(+) / protein_length=797 / sequence_SO=supercontig / SO=protein_coding / is_pseudo=false